MKPHYPRIRIKTPTPSDGRPFTEAVFTSIEVDGDQWPITSYSIKGGSTVRGEQEYQTVTLTFVGDVTIEHS
jgi:hypothetical protein